MKRENVSLTKKPEKEKAEEKGFQFRQSSDHKKHALSSAVQAAQKSCIENGC